MAFDDLVRGKWALSDTPGGLWKDKINGHHLTEFGTGSPSSVTDSFGRSSKAIEFNGTDQYLEVADNPDLSITGDISIASKFKLNAVNKTQILACKFKWNNKKSYRFSISSSNKLQGLLSSDGTAHTLITGGTTLTIDTWYTAKFIKVNNLMHLYLNNVSDATPIAFAGNIYNADTAFTVGIQYLSGLVPHGFFDGAIDDLQIWAKGLSSDERTVYQNMKTDFQTLYDFTRKNFGKVPTTLVRITIDGILGTKQLSHTDLFSEKEKPLHLENPNTARPYLLKDDYLGQHIQETITTTGRMTHIFEEDFTGSAGYWKQWIADNPFYLNRKIETLKGFAGFEEALYKTTFEGKIKDIRIRANNRVEIVSETKLQLTDIDYPPATDGRVGTAVAGTGNIIAASGTDMTQYSASGYIKIETELIKYTSITSETFNVSERGAFNADGWSSIGTTHAVGKVIQQVIVFENQNPMDITNALLVVAGLDDTIGTGDIDNGAGSSFNLLKDVWFAGIQLRGFLDEPTKITKYLKEIKDVCFFSTFQNADQKVAFSYLAPPLLGVVPKSINDDNNIIFRSSSIDDTMDKQITSVVAFYDLKGGTSGKDPFDYEQVTQWTDGTRETRYLQQKPKTIRSRWVRDDTGGVAFTTSIARNYIRVFGDGRKTAFFELETKDDDLEIGDIFLLTTDKIQDSSGADIQDRSFFCIKKEQVEPDKWAYIAYDAALTERIGFYAPSDHPDYLTATTEERAYGFYSGDYDIVQNGNISSGTKVISNLSDTSEMYSDMVVAGTGIVVGSVIDTVDSATQVTININTTSTGTFSLTFTDTSGRMSNGDPPTNYI